MGTAREEAERLYHSLFETQGDAPSSFSDLLRFVMEDGANVSLRVDAPDGFAGILMGDTIYLNANPRIPEHKRVRFLAHEYAHWKRRSTARSLRPVRLYAVEPLAVRDAEEQVARAFERLF